MGCVLRKSVTPNEGMETNIFKVFNVDQDGNNHLPGKLEVTSEDLLLHNKKKEIISWPIRTLRRYGYDEDLFSFEAGRRCHTGEGIFGFRCDQAEQLFRLLQTNIQRSGNNSSNHTENNPVLQRSSNDSSNNIENNPIFLTSTGYYEPRIRCLQSEGSTSSSPCTPPQIPGSTEYKFEHGEVEKCSVAPASIQANISFSESPLYINVPSATENGENDTVLDTYMCLFEKADKQYSPPPTILSSDELYKGDQTPDKLQYIILSLDNEPASPMTAFPTHEEGRSPGYTTIDFQKTWALVQTTKPNIENDIGCTRRTRHNSTLFDVQALHR